MAFTPENPEDRTDLFCLYDDELNEQAFLMYDSDEGTFYRNAGEWVAISESDETEPDINGLIVAYVTSALISVYDEAEAANQALQLDEIEQYEPAE